MSTAIEVVREYWRLMATNDFVSVGSVLSRSVIVDWPQSNERIRGAERFAAMNEEYPAHGLWTFRVNTFRVNKLIGNTTEVVTDVSVSDGVQHARAISFFTVEHGKIVRIVEFWPEPYAAPERRRRPLRAIHSGFALS